MIGLFKIPLISKIALLIKSFKTRVAADGGTFEAESCLKTTLTQVNNANVLQQASLVITPNAVKAGKLDSVIPNDGTGDLDVVRATTATRVNEQGFIETLPYNLIKDSQTYETSSWYKLGGSVTSNVTTSPDGTLTADLFTEGTNTGNHNLQTSYQVVQNFKGKITFTGWFKPNGRNELFITEANQTGFGARVNISTGNIVSTIGSETTATIVKNQDGWCFVTIKFNFPDVINFVLSYSLISYSIDNPGGTNSYSGDGVSGIYVWGSQLVMGDIVKPYLQTTDRLNIARIDYTNGSCPSILVEPQRTNLVLRSNELNTSPWAILLNEVSIDQNFDISPDNTQNANRINFLAGNTRFTQVFTVTQNTTYTISFYIKNINTNQISINIGSTSLPIINYFSQISVNEWRRVSFTFTTNSGVTSISPQITRDATIGCSVLIYGVQLEAGSTATSYIPTTSSAVTRNADVISKTGISSLIGQTEGTIFCDIDVPGRITGDGKMFSLIGTGGISNNRISMGYGNDRYGVDFVYNGSFTQIFTDINQPRVAKLCVKYDNFSYKFFVNGVLIGTNNSLTPLGLSELYLGSYGGVQSLNGGINKFLMFKTALTDQQCISMTQL